MITKEKLLIGLVGMFIGVVCSKAIIYFLAAEGWEDVWLVDHRYYTALIFSLVFGLVTVVCSSFVRRK